MYTEKIGKTIVYVTAIAGFAVAATVHADEGTIIGRVARGADDSAVRVCFNRGVEVKPGEQFEVVRHSLRPASPKATPVIETSHVGVLRIAAPSNGHCANAVLVSGSANWLDWVSSGAGS